MNRLIIQLAGGLIQDVFKEKEGPVDSVLVIDEDTEGALDSEITEYRGEDGAYADAVIHTQKIKILPDACDMAMAIKAYDND